MDSAARNDDEFTFGEIQGFFYAVIVFVIQTEVSAHHQEKFVFLLVVMPDELALEFYEFYLLAVQFTGDFRRPVFGKGCQFVRQVHFLHAFTVTGKREGGWGSDQAR